MIGRLASVLRQLRRGVFPTGALSDPGEYIVINTEHYVSQGRADRNRGLCGRNIFRKGRRSLGERCLLGGCNGRPHFLPKGSRCAPRSQLHGLVL